MCIRDRCMYSHPTTQSRYPYHLQPFTLLVSFTLSMFVTNRRKLAMIISHLTHIMRMCKLYFSTSWLVDTCRKDARDHRVHNSDSSFRRRSECFQLVDGDDDNDVFISSSSFILSMRPHSLNFIMLIDDVRFSCSCCKRKFLICSNPCWTILLLLLFFILTGFLYILFPFSINLSVHHFFARI